MKMEFITTIIHRHIENIKYIFLTLHVVRMRSITCVASVTHADPMKLECGMMRIFPMILRSATKRLIRSILRCSFFAISTYVEREEREYTRNIHATILSASTELPPYITVSTKLGVDIIRTIVSAPK